MLHNIRPIGRLARNPEDMLTPALQNKLRKAGFVFTTVYSLVEDDGYGRSRNVGVYSKADIESKVELGFDTTYVTALEYYSIVRDGWCHRFNGHFFEAPEPIIGPTKDNQKLLREVNDSLKDWR